MRARSYQALSTAQSHLDWSVDELFSSPVVRVSSLQCHPDVLGRSCEKCAVDNQLVFVTRGGFVRHTGRQSQVANAGKAMFFGAGVPYRTSHLHPAGDCCIVFSFASRDLLRETPDIAAGPACAVINPPLFAEALALAASAASATITALEVEECALALLARALACRPPTVLGAAARALVQEIESLLTASPGTDWSLTALSRRFDRTPFYITRLFRRVTGLPLHRYLVNLRLAAALARLADGEDNITTLAFDLGFSSHGHFSATFRKALAVSPTAFRGMRRSDGSARKWKPAYSQWLE